MVRSHQASGQSRPKTGARSPARGPEALLSNPKREVRWGAEPLTSIDGFAGGERPIGPPKIVFCRVGPSGPRHSILLDAFDESLDVKPGPEITCAAPAVSAQFLVVFKVFCFLLSWPLSPREVPGEGPDGNFAEQTSMLLGRFRPGSGG